MSIVPASWMPAAPIRRIHGHWTAGGHRANATDLRPYHILIEGDGKLVRGNSPISTTTAHTLNANTGAAAVAMCCMAGAVERPFNPGRAPMTKVQWDVFVRVMAELATRYGVPVTDKTTLTHAEVQPNLGIAQRGKWDIAILPFDRSFDTPKKVGDRMRREIIAEQQQEEVPVADNPIVVDLSHHNPTPDWAKLKAGGTLGVIHKATEGTSYVDPTLFSRARAAMDAGLVWSTYHFLRPGSLQAQMDHYLGTVNPRRGERVCLDHEDAGVSLDDLINCVAYLWSLRPDLQIAIYSGHLIKEQIGGIAVPELADTSLWLAQYTTGEPTWPKQTWPVWSLWQYTDKATASGISQPVDGNRWNGSNEALLKWFGPAEQPAPAPEPAPAPDIGPVKVDITSPAGVRVQVAVNGKVLEEVS